MISENQKKIIYNRVKETIKIFLENNGQISDEQIVELLSLSGIKSSCNMVDKDLTGFIAAELLPDEVYQSIRDARIQNKKIDKVDIRGKHV